MSEENIRKGRKAISRRAGQTDDSVHSTPQTLRDLFDIFIKAKQIEGLRERTLHDHRTHFTYFMQFLERSYETLPTATQTTVEIIREYIHYLQNDNINLSRDDSVRTRLEMKLFRLC